MDMINALVTGLLLTFSWSTFSVMMIGIVIGSSILPGLAPHGYGSHAALRIQNVGC
jgi:TctA family transporter